MLRISNFSIEALNGVFHYQDCTTRGPLEDLIILYGDNGSGKTTILHLIFNLLSTSPGRGHLNAVARVPFKLLKVELSDGTKITAKRASDVNSLPIVFTVNKPNSKIVEYKFIPEKLRDRFLQDLLQREYTRNYTSNKSRSKTKGNLLQSSAIKFFSTNLSMPDSDEEAHKNYLAAIKNLNLNCYYMATDRRMRSDAIEETRPQMRESVDVEKNDDGVIPRVRAQYLKDALGSASRYINRQLIRASNTGSKNTNDIYVDLIGRIANEDINPGLTGLKDRMEEAKTELKKLEAQNLRFSNLGISPVLKFDVISQAITSSSTSDNKNIVLEKILRPYIDSLNARLSALDPIGDVVETFLNLLNDLFKYKSINFSPSQGFSVIEDNLGKPLEVEQLSSGEQQLLLMFCYLLVSNESPSIFIIDEPEISLNIKWQRELIDAMRLITKDSQTQIIIATHSLELLTQYSDMVIQLEPKFEQLKPISNGTAKEED